MRLAHTLLIAAVFAAGCQSRSDEAQPSPPADEPPASPPSSPVAGVTDRLWQLTMLGGSPAPMGNGDRPVTLQLESASMNAGGFAGCNQYGGPFTISGSSLSFGPSISTKMACDQGMDVETGYLSMLPNVTRYEATDSTLTLMGSAGPLARFRAGS